MNEMKIKELIDILSKEDPEKNVYVSYDSMVCQCPVNIIIEIYPDDSWKEKPGIHLLAGMHYTDAMWHLGLDRI